MKQVKQISDLLCSLLAIILMAMSSISCSSDNAVPEEPQKPDTSIDEADWQDVPAKGGTIEKGDIALTFPTETFSTDTKVAITEVEANELAGDNARSKFYQVTLPETGTGKPFTIKLKCDSLADNVCAKVSTPGLNRNTGETIMLEIELDPTIVDGEMTFNIPVAESDGNERPYFTIGLAETVPGNTTAETRAVKDYWVRGIDPGDYAKNKAAYDEAIILIETNIPPAYGILSNILKFEFPTEPEYITYSMSKDKDLLKGAWAVFNPCFYFKVWSYVYLNERRILDYLASPSIEKLNQIKSTILHETLHAYTYFSYDKRNTWWISTKGEWGDDWAQFDEAVGCWVEKLIGAKQISENTVKWQRNFIREFYPHKRNQETCKACGYGMATFVEFLARKTSDQHIVKIYEALRDGNTNFRQVIKAFLKENNIEFFDTKNYWDFAFSVINNKFTPLIRYDNIIQKVEEALPDIRVTGDMSIKDTVFNYGVSFQQRAFQSYLIKEKATQDICLTQNTEGLLSRFYYSKGDELIEIGQSRKGDTLRVAMEDFCKYYGVNPEKDIVLKMYIATTRDENKDDYSMLFSDISLNFKKPETTALKNIEVNSIWFDAELKSQYTRTYDGENHLSDGTASFGFTLSEKSKVTTKMNGTTLHLEASENYEDSGGGSHSSSISFDITNFTGDFKKTKVTNVVIKKSDYYSADEHNESELHLTNVSFERVYAPSTAYPWYNLYLKSTGATGLQVTSASTSSCGKYSNGKPWSSTSKHIPDDSDYAKLEFYFKPSD